MCTNFHHIFAFTTRNKNFGLPYIAKQTKKNLCWQQKLTPMKKLSIATAKSTTAKSNHTHMLRIEHIQNKQRHHSCRGGLVNKLEQRCAGARQASKQASCQTEWQEGRDFVLGLPNISDRKTAVYSLPSFSKEFHISLFKKILGSCFSLNRGELNYSRLSFSSSSPQAPNHNYYLLHFRVIKVVNIEILDR